jgi:hypothetical protein
MGEMSGNFYGDDVIPEINALLDSHKTLRYLNLSGSKLTREGIEKISASQNVSIDLDTKCQDFDPKYLDKGPWRHVHKNDVLREFKHPKRVVHIDSIYRGKM